MDNVMAVYLVVFTIVGLVAYHSIFDIWYFNFSKALAGELIGACIFGIVMTAITLYYWPVSSIILIILGLVFSAKISSPVGKIIIIGFFIVAAIVTALTGRNYSSKQTQEEKKAKEQEEYSQSVMDNNEDEIDDVEETESQSEDDVNNDEDYESDDSDENEDKIDSEEEDYVYVDPPNKVDSNEESYDYILPESNTRKITKADLENLNAKELTYARNEIYARHGMVFKSKELQEYFSKKDWYYEDESFDGVLPKLEQKNANFIKTYQISTEKEYKLD